VFFYLATKIFASIPHHNQQFPVDFVLTVTHILAIRECTLLTQFLSVDCSRLLDVNQPITVPDDG